MSTIHAAHTTSQSQGMTAAQYRELRVGDHVRYIGPDAEEGDILEVEWTGKVGAHPHSIPAVRFRLGDDKFPTTACNIKLNNFELIA